MKKTAIFARILSALLVLCMLLTVFAACQAENEDGSSDGTQGADATTPCEEATDELKDDLPEDLKFDRDFKILGNQNRQHQYWSETSDATAGISAVIYQRNSTVEDRLGVALQWTFLPGEGNNISSFVEAIKVKSDSGDPFDGVIAYNLVPQVVANQGLAANLYDTEYIDLNMPWWPEVYQREMIVNDQLYCLVESGSYGLLNHMMAMYFSNDLLNARKMESPYTLVENNQWTVTKLSEMIKDTYEDKDGNGAVDKNTDVFGYCTGTKSKMDCWFFALGNQMSVVQDNTVISLLGGDHIGTFVDTMVDFFEGNDAQHYDSSQFKMFRENRVYFYCSSVMLSENLAEVPDAQYNYGVVPMPKMDSNQERYYTHVANCHDTWCVPYNVKDMDCTSAVMECMAYEAYMQINPTYYDIYVKLRYASDERLAAMYDLIRDSVTFDFIYLFSRSFPSMPGDLVKNCVLTPESKQWATVYAQNQDSLNQSFESIVATYESK